MTTLGSPQAAIVLLLENGGGSDGRVIGDCWCPTANGKSTSASSRTERLGPRVQPPQQSSSNGLAVSWCKTLVGASGDVRPGHRLVVGHDLLQVRDRMHPVLLGSCNPKRHHEHVEHPLLTRRGSLALALIVWVEIPALKRAKAGPPSTSHWIALLDASPLRAAPKLDLLPDKQEYPPVITEVDRSGWISPFSHCSIQCPVALPASTPASGTRPGRIVCDRPHPRTSQSGVGRAIEIRNVDQVIAEESFSHPPKTWSGPASSQQEASVQLATLRDFQVEPY
ncbi:hypothetical protein N7532_006105 [Penicillium argentinense]|uniref:Uncharacterized protein n=1 Tax=Penicillium argentinense TaxID=1131581 RepID=A0A9W9KAF5_9EURO|nr:uncharacterized protein N7532_006105 [Penicillium argentinense]KAJ5099104.1 hypothetical protein N7532_006105 [Penicillium argentinense]